MNSVQITPQSTTINMLDACCTTIEKTERLGKTSCCRFCEPISFRLNIVGKVLPQISGLTITCVLLLPGCGPSSTSYLAAGKTELTGYA